MSFVDAIGIISGILTIVSFGQDNFASDSSSGSTIKVAVALDGPNGPTDAGGDLPDVYVKPRPLPQIKLTAPAESGMK